MTTLVTGATHRRAPSCMISGETTSGALVADDKTRQPVAIIENDKPWCMDADQELDFHVEIDGPGDGFYLFGVWARPTG